MPIYTDANGDEIELPTAEEVNELRSKADKINDLEAELDKLRNKDMNFKNLHLDSKEEKKRIREEMEAQMSEKERYLMEEIDTLKGSLIDRAQREADALNQRKEVMIQRLAKGDDSMKQKIETHFSRLGTPISDQDMFTQVDEAYALAARDMEASINPVNTYVPGTTGPVYPSHEKRQNFADTPEGKSLAKDLGLRLQEPTDNK